MKRIIYYLKCPVNFLLRSILVVMFASCLCAQTRANGAHDLESTFVTLRFRNACLKDILIKIQKQSVYSFSFDEEVTNIKNISINVKEKPLSAVLRILSGEAQVSFHQIERMISVIRKVPPVEIAGTPPAGIVKAAENVGQVTGVVSDNKTGETLPGVNIFVKGTTKGTSTDVDGRYSIFVEVSDVLVFSYVGYKAQEILVGDRNMIDIKLLIDEKQLEDIVVVGYGEQKKISLTSAVSSVNTTEFKDVPYTDITAALAGRVAGVIVAAAPGDPGTIPAVTIRGGEPLLVSARTEPLYVIDGIIRTKTVFSSINISDIASISFLKDAASAAVYGSQATGGIVLVTTKSGGEGKPGLEYSGNSSYNTPTFFPKLINSYDRAVLSNTINANLGLGNYSVYSREDLEAIRTGSNRDKFPNTDWLKLCFRDIAPQQQHNLSLTGGSRLTRYYLGFGFLNQGSNYVNNAAVFKRYSYNSKVSTTFEGTGLTVSLGLNGYLSKSVVPPVSSGVIFSHLLSRSPLEHAFNKDGTLAGLPDHPLAEIFSPGYGRTQNFFTDGNITFKWDVPWVRGLSARVLLDYSTTIGYQKTFLAYAPQFNTNGSAYVTTKPILTEANSYLLAYNNEFQVDYNRSLGIHGIGATFVAIARAGKGYSNSAARKNFPSAAIDQMFAGDAATQTNKGTATNYGNVGFVGRLKYDYGLKYMIELAGRYDGVDNFPPGKRFGLFPAVSAAWVVSAEKFYRNFGLNKVFSELKFRSSFGKTGAGDGRYAYLSTYSIKENTFVSGGNLANGYTEGPLTVADQDITWYATTSFDLAVDFVTLNRQLSGSFDFYDTQSKNILGSPAYRNVDALGKPLPFVLTDAHTQKRGFDASIRYDFKVNKKVNGYVGFNAAFFNYLWVKSNEDSITLSNPYLRNQGNNQNTYGLTVGSNGLFQDYNQILNNPSPLNSNQTALGDVWYTDANGDGKIDYSDLRRNGKSEAPQFVYGIPFGITYKCVTFDVLWQGTGRKDVAFGSVLQGANGESNVVFDFQKDYWAATNTNGYLPRPGGSSLNGNNNYSYPSTYWLKNTQFLRLKSVSIAYDFSPLLKDSKFLKHFSVHISGTNLLTWSGVSKYFDPELTNSSLSYYPANRTYAVGVRAKF